MASKTGGLQDQNLNIRFNEASVVWKTNVSKAPSKRGASLAGRTPLGDLSNSLKPSMNRATRKQSSTLFSPLIEKEAVTSGIALDATKKKNTSKASLKQQLAGRLMSQKCSAEASVGWKTNVSKAPSKRGAALAGRTPLGDLSNSLKPSMNRATRKQSSTLVSPLIEKEAITSGIALDATKKKNTSKASLKQQPAGRKALFDISNSGKPQVNVASKRNYNTKLGVVAEVAEKEAVPSGIALDTTKKKNTSKASLKQQPEAPFDIFDEGFLHNHEECIKSRALLGVGGMNRWLEMTGLVCGEQKSPLQTPSASFRKVAVKHKEAHDNSDSPPIIRKLLPEPSVSDSDDSDSRPISSLWSCDEPDFRLSRLIDYHDDLRIDIDRDWMDTDNDCELKSP